MPPKKTPESTPNKAGPREDSSKTNKEKAKASPSQKSGPKREHFWLGIRREFENVRIFTARRWPRIERPEYADLYCPKCGSLDCLEALRRGVSKSVLIRNDVDWAYSSDGVTIISASTKTILEKIAGDELTFFPFQDGKYFVLWPVNVIEMPPDTGFLGRNRRQALIYSTKSPCSECGRLMDGYIRPAEHDYSNVPNLVALALPRAGEGVHFALICHNHIGEKLQEAGIGGWRRSEIDVVLPKR